MANPEAIEMIKTKPSPAPTPISTAWVFEVCFALLLGVVDMVGWVVSGDVLFELVSIEDGDVRILLAGSTTAVVEATEA